MTRSSRPLPAQRGPGRRAVWPDPLPRATITASPNRATIDRVAGLPPTLLLVDEADVLRDEGEAYAAKLCQAGVAITTARYDGAVHDFMLLNSVSETKAARAAIAQATAYLRAALGTSLPDRELSGVIA